MFSMLSSMPSLSLLLLLLLHIITSSASSIPPPQLLALGTESLDSGAAMAVCAVDATSGKVTKVADLQQGIGSGLPACFQLLPGGDLAAVCTVRGSEDCIAIVSAANGSTIALHCSTTIVISNLAVDGRTGQVFFNGYNTSSSKNFVYELHLDTGLIISIVHVPGIVQVCINAYSSLTQTFYLTAQSDDRTGNKIVSVHIPSKHVTEILFSPALFEILMVDPTSDSLFAWNADTTYAALLQTINASTGQAHDILTSSLSLSGNGGSAVVAADGLVYSTLLDYTSYNQPWWVVYDPKHPGTNSRVIMPMQEWACNFLLGIAQA